MNQYALLLPFLIILSNQEPNQIQITSQDFNKKLTVSGPKIEKMITELKYTEAYNTAKLLISQPEPYDGHNTAAAFKSAITYYNFAQAYHLAFRAADASGHWEDALMHAKMAQELARINKIETERALAQPMKTWEDLRDKGKRILINNASRIAELKSKQNPTNAELNELDDYLSAEKNYQVGEESAKTLLFAWDRGTKYAKSYDAYVDYIQQKIEEQEKEIASYAPTKGDRAKWAEAISQAPSYLNTFTETKEKVAFIHRLMVLAPGSPKVKRALDIALGKSVAPEPKSKATQKK